MNAHHEQKDIQLKALKEKYKGDNDSREAQLKAEPAENELKLQSIHQNYLSFLAKHINANQITKVKDAMTYTTRHVKQADAEVISALVQRSFAVLAAQDWETSACTTFFAESSSPAMHAKLAAPAYAAAAFDSNKAIGFILMPVPSRLSMLFVDPGHLRHRPVGCAYIHPFPFSSVRGKIWSEPTQIPDPPLTRQEQP